MSRAHAATPAWRDAVREQFGVGQHDATLDDLDSLLERMQADASDLGAHLTEFGRRCGLAGHSLDDTAAWISLFAATTKRATKSKLVARSAAIHLAGGWMTGHNELMASATVDPFDVTALRARLIQEYDRHDAFGLDVSRQVSLVILEPVFAEESVPSAAIAAVARSEFNVGHTVAECPNGRVIVLSEHSDDLANVARTVASKAARSVGAAPSAVRAWIESLASDRSTLDEFLSDLTG